MIQFPLPILDFTIIPILVLWVMLMTFLEYKFPASKKGTITI